MAFDYKKEYREFYLPGQNTGDCHGTRYELSGSPGQSDPNEKTGLTNRLWDCFTQ